MSFNKAALDRHITGNWGEDQFANADRRCWQEMRTGNCQLDPGHRGRHSTVVFYCDICGKRRRGQPHTVVTQLMSDGYREPVVDVCFMCAVVDVERRSP